MSNKIDVSLYPIFREQTLSMIDELDAIQASDMRNKASEFEKVLKGYGCLPS